METAEVISLSNTAIPAIVDEEKRSELVLDALKSAVAIPGDHRLFRWGKLGGLFPSKLGISAAAARFALDQRLIEHVRTESRGRLIVEWVRATPNAIDYLNNHDSPRAVLRELKDVIGETRAGVPVWMAQARDEAAQLAMKFEHFSQQLLRRLDNLNERVDAAIKRAEVNRPRLGDALNKRVPWAQVLLNYLDQRSANAPDTRCHLGELFAAVRSKTDHLTLLEYHEGIRTLVNAGLLQAFPGEPGDLQEPEYAVEIAGKMIWWVQQ